MEIEGQPPAAAEDEAVRFEDLTVDDDLPILDRVVRYMKSQVALQRLVHVKMLAETAELAGPTIARDELVPAVKSLVKDPEVIIRQHLAAQLLPLSIVCMLEPTGVKVSEVLENPTDPKEYNRNGYDLVTSTVVGYLSILLGDPEVEVRRAASDALSGLVLHIRPEDVSTYCLPVPLKLVQEKSLGNPVAKKKSDGEQLAEELRITAANLLAEMGGAASEHKALQFRARWVSTDILPAVLDFCEDPSVRVRRSAIQALPRILGACTLEEAAESILPAFEKLSSDENPKVRKSAGECLVDLSRALMILSASESRPEQKATLHELRRTILLPIADRLIQDAHRAVRQGMMQFLGPFVASFYPYQYSPLHSVLPASTESDGSNHMGIAAQFFPHATSMVSRLNSSHNAVGTAPMPVHGGLEALFPQPRSDLDRLQEALPTFIHASRLSSLSLQAVTAHRLTNPPDKDDVGAVMEVLLDYFAALAVVSTGDVNTDAEMRVYCAYSFPAVVLLLGPENWEGSIRTCFYTLLNPNYGQDDSEAEAIDPPLPVKRCLASSLHTVAHIVGPELAVRDILPVVQDYFLKDSDDSVRLNMLRNFPALLKMLPERDRRAPFLMWSEIVHGEEFLGAKKRSATNPLVLNWRQRDYLARSAPELIGMLSPDLVHEHLWPILKELITDPVNIVRDDALWSIPILLKSYCAESAEKWTEISNGRKFSTDACSTVVQWLRDTILKTGSNTDKRAKPNFTDRQLFCRVCAAVALALRFGEGLQVAEEDKRKDPVSVLSDKFKSFFHKGKPNTGEEYGPYQKLTSAEQKHLRLILVDELLPHALEMKEDWISNVRIALMRVLLLMPEDIREMPHVKSALKDLVEEAETWESFHVGGQVTFSSSELKKLAATARGEPLKETPSKREPEEPPARSSGPVDTDITPQSSRDDSEKRPEPDGAVPESLDGESGEIDIKDLERTPKVVGAADEGSSSFDVGRTVGGLASEEPPGEDSMRSMDMDESATSFATVDDSVTGRTEDETAWTTVVFDDGPIGMQLEPTKGDRACRIYGFQDASPEEPSPARVSGKVKVGDVIVKVNGVTVSSYDETITILKAGGYREIKFRPGDEDDIYVEDEEGAANAGATEEGSEEDDKKKKPKKDKKAKKKKKEKEKEEKKAKKEKKKKSKEKE